MMQSLRVAGEDGPIYVVCFDEDAASAVEQASLSDAVRVVRIAELESEHPDLAAVRDSRSRVEYYFSSTPTVIAHVLASEPEAAWVTYLDADLWFFSSPDELYEEQGPGSVGIVEHGYRGVKDAWRRKFGTYNVGWVSFRNDADGLVCVLGSGGDSGASNGATTGAKTVGSWTRVISTSSRTWSAASSFSSIRARTSPPGISQPARSEAMSQVAHSCSSTSMDFSNGVSDGTSPTPDMAPKPLHACAKALYRPYLEALVASQRTIQTDGSSGPRRRGSITGGAKHGAVRLLALFRGDARPVIYGN